MEENTIKLTFHKAVKDMLKRDKEEERQKRKLEEYSWEDYFINKCFDWAK